MLFEEFAEIPALATWKMLSNTIQLLHNIGTSGKGLELLSNFVQKPEMSQMFVIPSNNLSHTQFAEMSVKYKAFTTWVLGQFFHLSTMPNFQTVQSSLIDAQNRILYQIKLTAQSHTYFDLVVEYITVMEQLNTYAMGQYEGEITLDAFLNVIPADLNQVLNIKVSSMQVTCRETCVGMNQVLLQLFEIVAIELSDCYHTGATTIRLMNALLSLLIHTHLKLKLSVLHIFAKTLQSGFAPSHDCLPIKRIQHAMFSIFESLFIGHYKQHPSLFESLAIDIIHVFKNHENKLYEFIIQETKTGKLKALAMRYCCKTNESEKLPYLSRYKVKIINEIQQFATTHLYDDVFQHVCDKLRENRLCDEEDAYEEFLEVCFCAKLETQYVLLDETKFVEMFVKSQSSHIENCTKVDCKLNAAKFFNIMSLVVAIGNSKYVQTIYNCFDCLWNRDKTILLTNPHFQRIFIELRAQHLAKAVILKHWTTFITSLSIYPDECYATYEQRFISLAATIMESTDVECQHILIDNLVPLLAITTIRDEFFKSLLAPAIIADDRNVQRAFTHCLPQLFAIFCTKFDRFAYFHNHSLCVDIREHSNVVQKEYYVLDTREQLVDDLNNAKVIHLLKGTLRFLKPGTLDTICTLNAIKSLPYVAKFVPSFKQIIISKWFQAVEIISEKNIIQNTMISNIFNILQYPLNDSRSSDDEKQNFLTRFFEQFMDCVDKSLRLKDKLHFQYTLCSMLEPISFINHPSIELTFLKLVLHYIVMVTSNVKDKALAVLITYQERMATILSRLFTKYRRELYKIIAHVCVINYVVAKCELSSSLEMIAVELGYADVKHLLVEDTRYILPYFISGLANSPEIQHLLDKIAFYNETELKYLLADNYGYIYVHLTLNAKEKETEECLSYLEKYTGENGITLRKTNFMIILNELLLHFYDQRDRVLHSLHILASEDSQTTQPATTIKEYLRPRLLGVLQYFDLKLLGKSHNNEKKLLSLSAIFHFMGPKYITPVRFKIIAMLRTVLTQTEGTFMHQHCIVWEAFLHNCDLEILRPQLPAICASINPLIPSNSTQINSILSYLIIENEQILKDYIIDLFFLLDFDIDFSIKQMLNKYVKKVQEMSFRKHLMFFMKYLTYDTLEIQIYALKYITKLLRRNKSELEDMILGHNGIDTCLIELINYLLRGCRECDAKLQLACGEVIGELGAIEPSHLPPPRSVHDDEDFTFYITEPKFIANSLNEFARAMQAEVNCQNMDRFALAIQETLRTYGIGPQAGDNEIWNSLTESQKELMLPLVSSKYCNVSTIENFPSGPIYGSGLGSTFKLWLDNWTTKLISTITSSNNQLLCLYMPSMKQDNRTLMYFLPHILLNSIIEGTVMQHNEAFDEFMAVIESQNEQISEQEQNDHLIRSNQLPYDPNKQSTPQRDHLKVVFVLFDFLERWQREWIWEKGYAGQENRDYQRITQFTRRFCKYTLAKRNFAFGGYSRALMYLEDHIMSNADDCEEYLSLLSKIYYRLSEPDAVAGVTALRQKEANLEQRILDHEVSGEIPLATACYERLMGNHRRLMGIVKSHLDQNNAHTALHIAKSAWEQLGSNNDTRWMLEAQSEALWRLGSYDELQDLLKRHELRTSNDWGVQTGSALMHFRNGDRSDFQQQLDALKMVQVSALGASRLDEGTYQYGYYYIARLHAINELEHVENVINEILLRPQDANSLVAKIHNEWDLRLKFVQQNVKVIEPILCLRRAALQIAREKMSKSSEPLFSSLLGETWLKSAIVALNSQFHKQAYSYIIKAEEFAPPRLFIEKAKWFWLCNEHEQSLTTLEQNLRVLLPSGRISDGENFPLWKRKLCAEAKLHVAKYNDTISNVVVDVNIQHYKEAVEMYKECEKSLVNLAQYYDRVFQNISDEDKDAKGSDMQIHMINYFGKSLQYGTEHVYQSMPRLLSIWFDYGTRLLDVVTPSVREQRKHNLLKMTKLIDTFLERLPSFIFLTAFSQIISRICHPQKEVYKELNLIIAKLILQYPQQTLWMMISVIKSSYALRSKRCTDVLTDSRLKFPTMVNFLKDFVQLAEKLIELTNKELPPNVSTINVSAVVRALPRLITHPDFSEIMIPTHKFRKLILPSQETSFKDTTYNPFPNHYVYIVGIEDEMTILPSLQKPRRIKLRGSDGRIYIQMLKPKDDLRKDFRLMEFNDIVNQLLAKEAESRERRLNIRLYSVAPLNEECGMIEWVPNLVGLRPTIMTIYKHRGLGMKPRELKEKCARQTDPLERKREIFTNILLAKHPPVLGDWFRRSFPDAHGWLTARTAYTRTLAVMSMVGHILGLGDRHGENILLDSACGDAVHVDFNCLFNKGEQFDWPERVPFRLTQNMVAAMGPLGVEGMFRKSCACTLHVLRTHANTLMSIVTPFVYDPLVSWPKKASSSTDANSERTNELALEHIKVIQQRLEGKVKGRSYSISLSVDGQTNKLITEAMSIDNLSQMYIGWGPYL